MREDLKVIRKEIAQKIKTSKTCDPWFYKEHFLVVEKFAKQLLRLYPDANKEAVILAVWFHDASRAYAYGKKENHDLEGANLARQVLTKKGFDRKLVDLVYEVCKSHRCEAFKPKSIEAKILATADAMSHFTGGFYLRLLHKWGKTMKYSAAKKRLFNKIERDFKEKILLKEAREAVKPLYQSWQKILREISLG